MIGREYEYRLKAGRVAARAFAFAAAAAGFAYMAATNDRGLVLFVVPLSRDNATIFYGVFAAVAAVIAACDAVNADRRGSLRQRIAFAEVGLVVPKTVWSTEEMLIPYESVVGLKEFNEPDSIVLIEHRGGVFTLRLDLLPDERAYAEILQALGLLVREAKVKAKPKDEPDL